MYQSTGAQKHHLSESSSKKSLSESSAKKKKRNKKKKRRKQKKHDASDSLSSNDSDLSNHSDYRCKRHKNNIHKKKDPIKLCARLTKKLLITTYKSKIIRFKMDEDLLQRRIYFLTFVESLEMIFSKYRETCKIIIDDLKIGGDDIEDYAKKSP